MISKKSLVASSLLFALFTALPASAHSVMEKVVKTGVLTAGTSKDAFPFAYRDKSGKLSGYSIDMLTLIQKQPALIQRPAGADGWQYAVGIGHQAGNTR